MIGSKKSERRELLAAGWQPKDKGGKTVWRNPKNGFWYPQQVAVALLGQDIPEEPEGEAGRTGRSPSSG